MPRLGGALDIVQVSDPATPATGRQYLYFKSDGHLYTKLPNGTVVQVDGGSAPSNMVTTDTGQAITGVKTFTNLSMRRFSDSTGPGTLTGSNILGFETSRWTGTAAQGDTGSLYARRASDTPQDMYLTGDMGIKLPYLGPLGLTGAVTPTRWVGGTLSGAPTTGTYQVGDFVLARDPSTFSSSIWVCVTAGTPGTWLQAGDGTYARLNGSNSFVADMSFSGIAEFKQMFISTYSLYLDSPNMFVEPNFNNITGPGQWQSSRSLTWKTRYWDTTFGAQSDFVTLQAARGSDTQGDTWLQSGTGFKGQWVAGDLAGNLGRYVGRTASVAPTTGTWKVGDFVNTTDGKFFTCTVAGTPGTWVQPGGGGQNPIVSAEFDVTAALTGGQAARSGRFTIADASFQAGQELYVQQSADAISTKGTRFDENEMDHIIPRGVVTGNGTATVYWSSNTYVKGKFRFNYRSS